MKRILAVFLIFFITISFSTRIGDYVSMTRYLDNGKQYDIEWFTLPRFAIDSTAYLDHLSHKYQKISMQFAIDDYKHITHWVTLFTEQSYLINLDFEFSYEGNEIKSIELKPMYKILTAGEQIPPQLPAISWNYIWKEHSEMKFFDGISFLFTSFVLVAVVLFLIVIIDESLRHSIFYPQTQKLKMESILKNASNPVGIISKNSEKNKDD
eukprot:TRINITY_DN1782_c1_g1_i1.p1 TRINITY_DN1782_c1_g1~~TRINITY_DN1782_c1_g1_i1.p1  ORF type:complete len:210 (-),score=57.79 TRINITY_DN1782_c1_g1_i1:74-703(-)